MNDQFKDVKSVLKNDEFVIELMLILFTAVYFLIVVGTVTSNLSISIVYMCLTVMQALAYLNFKKTGLDPYIVKIISMATLLGAFMMFGSYGIFAGIGTVVLSIWFILVTYRVANYMERSAQQPEPEQELLEKK